MKKIAIKEFCALLGRKYEFDMTLEQSYIDSYMDTTDKVFIITAKEMSLVSSLWTEIATSNGVAIVIHKEGANPLCVEVHKEDGIILEGKITGVLEDGLFRAVTAGAAYRTKAVRSMYNTIK